MKKRELGSVFSRLYFNDLAGPLRACKRLMLGYSAALAVSLLPVELQASTPSEASFQTEPQFAPLAPPPPSLDPLLIRRGVWRGHFWVSLQAVISGPLGGTGPAAGGVVATGGAMYIGVRPRPSWGVFTGFALAPHDARPITVVDQHGHFSTRYMTTPVAQFDIANLRYFVPVRGFRLQPRVDLGAGVFAVARTRESGIRAGGGARAGLGADLWLGRNLSLAFDVGYRLRFATASVGHELSGGIGVSVHR